MFFLVLRKILVYSRNRAVISHSFCHNTIEFLKPYSEIKIKTSYKKRLTISALDSGMVTPFFSRGNYERREIDLLKQLIKPGMITADVGAHVGYYSLFLSGLVGNQGKVYSFEPDSYNYSLLQKNVKRNKAQNIVTVKMAVCNTVNSKPFYINDNNFGDHKLLRFADHSLTRAQSSVQTTSLDSYFNKHGNRLDFVKIDVQGSEPLVLKGMKNIFGANKNFVMLMEFEPRFLLENRFDPKKFFQQLSKYNFNITAIGQSHVVKDVRQYSEISHIFHEENFVNLLCLKPGSQ